MGVSKTFPSASLISTTRTSSPVVLSYINLYLDSVYLSQSSTSGASLDSDNFGIMRRSGGESSGRSTTYHSGIFDELTVYNYSLSLTQIQLMYQEGIANHSVETIVSQETSVGDNWIVAVTPNDGVEDGFNVALIDNNKSSERLE